jgi:RHS repeat-associated protein
MEPVRVEDPLGRVTTFTYDREGRLLETVAPDGTRTSATWDALGRRTTETDELGHTTSYAYDAAGNLVRVTDARGGVTSYQYDAVGRLLATVDALGQTTRLRRDALGRVVEELDAAGAVTATTYDDAGNVATVTHPDGSVTSTEYDPVNRPVRVVDGDGEATSFVYDERGLVATVTDRRGTTGYERDAAGRTTAVDHPDGSHISWALDGRGNPVAVQVRPAAGAGEREMSYGWDPAGRLRTVNDWTGRATSYEYDLAGQLERIERAGGIETTFTYDGRGLVRQLTHRHGSTVVEQLDHDRDARGDLTAVTAADGSSSTYTYDELRRLTAEVHRDGAVVEAGRSYTLDAVGNRVTEVDQDGTTVTYEYGPNHRLLRRGDTTYTYDAAGNRMSATDGAGTTAFGYDARNQLAAVTMPDGATATFTYDHLGARVAERRGGVTTIFVRDPLAVTGFDEVVAEVASTDVTWNSFGLELLGHERGGVASDVLTDARGSVIALTDTDGAVTDRFLYMAFGDLRSRSGSTPQTYLYDGQRFDAGSGLYDLRARQYEPLTGRFTSVDPFAGSPVDPLSQHPYLYAHGNPVAFADPHGLFTLSAQQVAIGISATVSAAFVVISDYQKGQLGWGTVWRASVQGAVGGLTAVFGGPAATQVAKFAAQRVASSTVATIARYGGARLLMAVTKAFLATVGDEVGKLVGNGPSEYAKDFDGGDVALSFAVNLFFEFALQGGGAAEAIEEAFERNLRAAYKEQLAYVNSYTDATALAYAIKNGTISGARQVREAVALAKAVREGLEEVASREVVQSINVIQATFTEVVKKAKDIYQLATAPSKS